MVDPSDQDTLPEHERELNRFLTQKTQFTIFQYVLSHSHHLPSIEELSYLIPQQSRAEIRSYCLLA